MLFVYCVKTQQLYTDAKGFYPSSCDRDSGTEFRPPRLLNHGGFSGQKKILKEPPVKLITSIQLYIQALGSLFVDAAARPAS